MLTYHHPILQDITKQESYSCLDNFFSFKYLITISVFLLPVFDSKTTRVTDVLKSLVSPLGQSSFSLEFFRKDNLVY